MVRWLSETRSCSQHGGAQCAGARVCAHAGCGSFKSRRQPVLVVTCSAFGGYVAGLVATIVVMNVFQARAVHWNRSNMKSARRSLLNLLYVSYCSRRSRRCCTSRRPFWAQFDLNWTRSLTRSFSIACAAGSAAGAAVHCAGRSGRGGAACARPGRVLEGGHLYWAWPSGADCNTHQKLVVMLLKIRHGLRP